ncbi:hypothetical protein I2486_11995, partial [Cellulophaga sp. E16_2]|nr:hypothetical protein [Cellulophaga sp. E16_2]
MDIFTLINKYRKLLRFSYKFFLFLFVFTALSSFSGYSKGLDFAVYFVDSDRDKIIDTKDLDSDNDGILDTVEGYSSYGSRDTDGDGIPDYLDIDSDNDGILDNVEAQTTAGFIPALGVDKDMNGLDDAYEHCPKQGLTPVDTDGDGIPDYLDIDSDNDGILDNVEAQNDASYNPKSGLDANGNGLDDQYENYYGTGLTPIDTDGDKAPDYRDLDADNDGILDNVEAQVSSAYTAPCGVDSDGNGLDDHYENSPGSGEGITPIDTDGDGTPDFRDLDSDNDGCSDTMEAGFIDALLVENRDSRLGNVSPPRVNAMGKVISGENGEGYTTPLDSNANGILDFRESAYTDACNKMITVVDDTATTEENIPVVIDVLDNDSNIPSDGTLTVTTPENGVVVINDGGTPD